jgi:hypothetical protein
MRRTADQTSGYAIIALLHEKLFAPPGDTHPIVADGTRKPIEKPFRATAVAHANCVAMLDDAPISDS